MRKIIIVGITIFILFVFIQGCDNERDFKYFCADYVDLKIETPSSDYTSICYDEKGMINMLILNRGNTPVYGLNFKIYAENQNKNLSVPIFLNEREADLLSLNIQLKTLGDIKSIIITPNVLFENQTVECEIYNVRIRNINQCYY